MIGKKLRRLPDMNKYKKALSLIKKGYPYRLISKQILGRIDPKQVWRWKERAKQEEDLTE